MGPGRQLLKTFILAGALLAEAQTPLPQAHLTSREAVVEDAAGANGGPLPLQPSLLHAGGVRPYGARKLKNTNFFLLASSLLSQLRSKGIPEPRTFAPFPVGRGAKDERPHTTRDTVVGEPVKDLSIDKEVSFLNAAFPHQRFCQVLDVASDPTSYRVFVGLHETGHYVMQHVRVDQMSVEAYIFFHIRDIPAGRQAAFIDALEAPLKGSPLYPQLWNTDVSVETLARGLFADKTLDPKAVDRFLGARIEMQQIVDGLPDTAATLYILSNYGGPTPENLRLVDKIVALRTSLFTDVEHNIPSAAKNAADAYSRSPRPELDFGALVAWSIELMLKTPPETGAPRDYRALLKRDVIDPNSVRPDDARLIEARDRTCGYFVPR